MSGKDERERTPEAWARWCEQVASIDQLVTIGSDTLRHLAAALRERESRDEPSVECLECRQKYHPDQCREIMCEECYLAAEPQPEREPDGWVVRIKGTPVLNRWWTTLESVREWATAAHEIVPIRFGRPLQDPEDTP